MTAYNSHGDLCLSFWADAYPEYVDFKPDAHVLEIGCAEADWSTETKRLRPDLTIYGLDWRACSRPACEAVYRGDVLTWPCPPESFDAIVMVSALEHFGLGSYDHDPLDPDGDTHTMERCLEWLKPGGWVYLDVPYRPGPDGHFLVTSNYRAYDEPSLASRVIVPGFRERWRRVVGEGRGDGPYIALLLEATA